MLFWLVIFAAFSTFILFFSKVLMPFFIALVFAYLLNPMLSKVCLKYNIPRNIAASLVIIVVISTFIAISLLIMPIIYQQLSVLITKIPIYRYYIQTEIIPALVEKVENLDPKIANQITSSIQNFTNNFFLVLASLFNNVWNYTIATLNVITVILLVPIILLYLLLDWPKIICYLEDLLPIESKYKIKQILFAIDDALSAYIRGQLKICALLSVYYGVGLSILGIDLGLLIGIVSGFFIIVPFVGILISYLLATLIGYFSFVGSVYQVIYITLLYGTGYLIEGYLLTPKIIGKKIGLHPLWIMLSVFINGSLFGIIGMFFAIPLASIIKVLLGQGIEYYKLSNRYNNNNQNQKIKY
ncbi:MAG: AI-2E family transporter [Rickettsiaceae bacterium]|nr:MAG: AI-2E family transporter [Rickettsiaceae bacterium]